MYRWVCFSGVMASKTGHGSAKRPPKFIYELPYTVTRDLVELLNINDAWETLAGEHLQLRQTEISELIPKFTDFVGHNIQFVVYLMEYHLRSFDTVNISGKFRRYDQQPNNSAGNALWDLLSTRNTTIQVEAIF